MRVWRAALVLCLAGSAAAAQTTRPSTPNQPPTAATPQPSPTAATHAEGQASTEYRVGAGDVLDVVVFGNDDLSRTATVQTAGTMALPLLGEVPVAGLTVPEVQRKLTTLLARDYLVNPQVEVKVKEYQSQFVTVVGEVNSPGRKPVRGRTRLIDVLHDAGGFTPRASGDISITRLDGSFGNGNRSLSVRIGGGQMTPQDQVNLELPLRNGDIVTVQPKYYVVVEGEVNRPNRYQIDGELTVSAAISMAGGLTRFGSQDVKVRRVDPRTGTTQVVEVDLKAVRKGKKPDLQLLPNDVVSISRRLF
jgi:polysaccharide export outer membrane protein